MSQIYCRRLNQKAPRPRGKGRARPAVGFIVPEDSGSPGSTNQIMHQRGDYC